MHGSNSVPFIKRNNSGVVITVVISAMSTSMQNTLSGITPRSRPTLITTSYGLEQTGPEIPETRRPQEHAGRDLPHHRRLPDPAGDRRAQTGRNHNHRQLEQHGREQVFGVHDSDR